MPLRGKIINVEKNRVDKVLANNEIQALITAIGTGVGDEFNVDDLRYHKMILITNADVDGAHIRTLALTSLYRHTPEPIDAGYVYIAEPPLSRVKNEKQETYIEKESELEELLLRDKIEQVRDRRRRGRQAEEADRSTLGEVQPSPQGVRGLGRFAAGRVRPRAGAASSPSRRFSTRARRRLPGSRS